MENIRLRKLLKPLLAKKAVAKMGTSKPVIIYQMGKVASISIKASLDNIHGLEVYHVHHLNPDYARELDNTKRSNGWKVEDSNNNARVMSQALIEPRRPSKIITLIREPIGRNISAYFQNLDNIWQCENAHEKIHLNRLIKGFFEKYPHTIPLVWFDREFKETLGIDIYKYMFPKSAGVLQFYTDVFDVLLLYYDLPDVTKCTSIREFIGLKKFSLVKKNTANEKPYAEVYQAFLREIRFTESYVNEMLNSRYTSHFFDNDEIDRLRSAWLKRI